MRRRILSMFLAVMLVMTMTVTAFAGGYSDNTTINGEQYFATMQCATYRVTGSTQTTSSTALVSVELAAYNGSNVRIGSISSDNCELTARATLSSDREISYAKSWHYADGTLIFNFRANAS